MRCCLLALLLLFASNSLQAEDERTDVLVYGATPGGIAAALAAADDGEQVLLVEPTARIGGLVTSGLSHTDFRTFEGLNGTFLAFTRRVEAYYQKRHGADSQQVRDSFRGTFGEPHVNLAIYQAMIAERTTIRLLKEWQLAGVQVQDKTVVAVTLRNSQGEERTVKPAIVIDGSYEGDLLAAAGVPWRVGREARNEYQESLAPEKADEQLQAYNFRWIMTRDPNNRVTPIAPPGYRREDFLPVVELLTAGKVKTIFNYPSGCIFKAQTPALPNGKYDINDVSSGLIRLSLPGQNLDWPAGDAAARERVFAAHLRDQVGLLYFIQNDEAVPAKFRDEARQWGWCRDEFVETNHLPPQLYIREARRMVGKYIFTQRDSEHAPGDARAVFRADAIAMGATATIAMAPRTKGHAGEASIPANFIKAFRLIRFLMA